MGLSIKKQGLAVCAVNHMAWHYLPGYDLAARLGVERVRYDLAFNWLSTPAPPLLPCPLRFSIY